MKKLFWGFTIVLLLIVGTAVVGPEMIDWNRYKGEITRQAKTYTGRDLNILGDLQVSLIPAPAIIANEVTFANLDGAATPDMIKLQRAEVRIALSPLLAGQVKVETVRLIKPTIELELLADGRQNWAFDVPQPVAETAGTAAKPAAPAATTEPSEPTVVLDDFTIVDGALTYRDSKAGTIEKVEDLNARIEAASLAGPFQSKGALRLRDIPLTYDVTVGEVIQERTLPVNMKFGVEAGATSLQIGGTLLNLSEEPKFKGSLRGEGENLGLLIEAITRAPAPQALAQLFSAEAIISASMEGVELSGLQMQLAGSRIEGDVAVEIAETPRFSISLTAGRFDLDKWLSAASVPAPSDGAKRPSKATTEGAEKSLKTPLPEASAANDVQIEIPGNISGSVILSVEALVYRGEAINDVLVNTELAGGIAQLRQFSAQLPGGSDIAMSGKLSSPGGVPTFKGGLEMTTNDLRHVVKWLDVTLPDIPADRLRKVGFSSSFDLTPSALQLTNMDMNFDSSRLTGASTIALRSRPAFGLNLTLDQIDIDAYAAPAVEVSTGRAEQQAPAQSADAAAGEQPASQPKAAADNPFQGLAALGGFDANALVTIKRLGVRGESMKNVVVDATLYDGSLEFRKLSVGQVAGTSIATSGRINNLRNIPVADDLRVVAKTKDLTPLVRFAGLDLPFDAGALGQSSIDLRADGSILKPKIKSQILTAGATLAADGNLSLLPVGDMFDLGVNMSHPDLLRLLRLFGVKYRPAGKLGALAFSTRLSGKPTALTAKQLSGKLGQLTFSGDLAVNLEGQKPFVFADVKTGALIVDSFLPAAESAALGDGVWAPLQRRPVVWPGPRLQPPARSLVEIAAPGRWSTDPIDLGVLNTFDADIALKAPLVAYSKYLFENVDVAADIKGGTLRSRRLLASLFSGKLQGEAEVTSARSNQIASTFQLTGIEIAEALQSVTGSAAASGRLNANLDFIASGNSVSEIIGSLAGTGGFTMKNVDATAGAKGAAFAGIYNLLTSLNQLGSKRSGNNADVAGTFQIARGIARTNDFKLVSPLGTGSAAGTVNLPAWLLDITGQIELQQSALTQILQAKIKRGVSPVGFALSGPIDEPKVKVDTAALLGNSVPLPGADALLNKAPKGIGKLLKGIIGGGGGATPPPAPSGGSASDSGTSGSDTPPPPRSTQQQPAPAKELRPEDLLKQLFR